MAVTGLRPTLVEERDLESQGYRRVAGIDEVGRGALAGPVVAAAVILPQGRRARGRARVRDSKQLAPAVRSILSQRIWKEAVAIGIGVIPAEIIDRRGIVVATRLAMKSAVDQILPPPDYLLIDYMVLPESHLPQKGVADGDSLCLSIACASIVAKVARDNLMEGLDGTYPGYGLGRHKGYGTEQHLACLRRLGPCAIHRRSFAPVRLADET